MSEKIIECQGFTFLANFDSANLAKVEYVPRKPAAPPEPPKPKLNKKTISNNNTHLNRTIKKKTKAIEFPDYEFNIWTSPDCAGTEFENSNRTWFYFGITGGTIYSLVKLNIIDLNKQSKMYNQGMAPVCKTVPGKGQWERIRDKPVFTSENNIFTLSFKFRTSENIKGVTYFAFTYPFSYIELQNYLSSIDLKMTAQENHLPKPEIKFNKGLKINNDINDAIYYHRETLCYSLQNRIIDLITISSHHNITAEREPRLQSLFPDENIPRPFKYLNKKVIFISARVHPGETPSSFVMNGIINLLIQKDDPIAILLRRQFVFKLIPMLNPDGVALGHYRTDTRGCNLNRFYLNPSREFHPSIYGARAVIRYHHFREEKPDDYKQEKLDVSSQADPNEISESELSSQELESPKPTDLTKILSSKSRELEASLTEKTILNMDLIQNSVLLAQSSTSSIDVSIKSASTKPSNQSLMDKEVFLTVNNSDNELSMEKEDSKKSKRDNAKTPQSPASQDSGLYLYLDMHGHASKKGVFMYGNHFDKLEDSVECMLFPKIMSVNSQNFHFNACNFTEKNMYLRDKRDGTSREGSGRVAVLRLTGLIRSYTLECNYNTGKCVNKLPQCCRELPGKNNSNLLVPPKYSPAVYEEIGRSIGISILDMTNSNPWSRIPNSEYHTIFGIRDWLRIRNLTDNFLYHKPVPKSLLRSKPSNKSSQTQVEDFIAIGYNYDLKKKLVEIQPGENTVEFEKIPEVSSLSEVHSDEENEAKPKDLEPEKSLRSLGSSGSRRVWSKKNRAAQLIGEKNKFLALMENEENETLIMDEIMNLQAPDDNWMTSPRHVLTSIEERCTVMIGVLRSDVRPGKLLSNVLLGQLHSKQSVNIEHSQDELERKENVAAFHGAACNALMVNRKEPGPSHSKRTTNRVSSVLQIRGGSSRPKKSLKKTIYRGVDKLQKFKQYIQKADEELTGEPENKLTTCEGDRRLKASSISDHCIFKQSPKRLKISKGDEGAKIKVADWPKEEAVPGPSCSDMVLYSRLSRPVSSASDSLGKKRTKSKIKQQNPPSKFIKSLEKRRGSDASRKKSKTLFKKAGKIILTNDSNKNLMDRKRRKN